MTTQVTKLGMVPVGVRAVERRFILSIDAVMNAEFGTGIRADGPIQNEATLNVHGDFVPPTEALLLATRIGVPQLEFKATARYDQIVNTEELTDLRSDEQFNLENRGQVTVNGDAGIYIEVLAATAGDAAAQAENTAAIRLNHRLQTEMTPSVAAVSMQPYGFQSLIAGDGAPNIEVKSGVRSDQAERTESESGVRIDRAVRTEDMLAVRRESTPRIEALGGVVSTAPARLEIMAGVTRIAVPQIEAKSTVRLHNIMQLETQQPVLTINALFRLETMKDVRSDRGNRIEATSKVTGDTATRIESKIGVTISGRPDVEAASAVRATPTPRIESTSDVSHRETAGTESLRAVRRDDAAENLEVLEDVNFGSEGTLRIEVQSSVAGRGVPAAETQLGVRIFGALRTEILRGLRIDVPEAYELLLRVPGGLVAVENIGTVNPDYVRAIVTLATGNVTVDTTTGTVTVTVSHMPEAP